METVAYAAYTTNEQIRRESSSGGVWSILAGDFLTNGGIVYAAVSDGLQVCHRRIDRADDLPATRGSFYQPSRLEDTFAAVRQDIAQDKRVLFCGTPCQCAGLTAFLGGKSAGLTLIDCVCHGIPAPRAFEIWKEACRKRGEAVASVKMRDKASGWPHYSWRIRHADGTESVVPHREVTFMLGYIANLYLRPACYVCRFKGTTRPTDITLGDLWGAERIVPSMHDGKGTSLLLIHSEQGQALLDAARDRLRLAPCPLPEAVEANANIVVSSRDTDRARFWAAMKRGADFDDTVRRLSAPKPLARLKKAVRRVLKPRKG